MVSISLTMLVLSLAFLTACGQACVISGLCQSVQSDDVFGSFIQQCESGGTVTYVYASSQYCSGTPTQTTDYGSCDECDDYIALSLTVYSNDDCTGSAVSTVTSALAVDFGVCNGYGELVSCSSDDVVTTKVYSDSDCSGSPLETRFSSVGDCINGSLVTSGECVGEEDAPDTDSDTYFDTDYDTDSDSDSECNVFDVCFTVGDYGLIYKCNAGQAVLYGYENSGCSGIAFESEIVASSCTMCEEYIDARVNYYFESDDCTGEATAWHFLLPATYGVCDGRQIVTCSEDTVTLKEYSDEDCSVLSSSWTATVGECTIDTDGDALRASSLTCVSAATGRHILIAMVISVIIASLV